MPSQKTEHRKLAAIMFTDIVGYSAISQRNEALALELLEEHRTLLRSLFKRFNGAEVKTIGDAFLVEFHSALEAAQCAVEIQRTLAKRNHDVEADRRIEIKIGIHIGDVVHRGGDVYGNGVNIASRIEPLAGAGGICVSMDVERQIRNALEARFEKLAPTELKNISVAMDLFRIVLPWEKLGDKSEVQSRKIEGGKRPLTFALTYVWIGVLLLIAAVVWWRWHQGNQGTNKSASAVKESGLTVDQKSIAVLPFVNMSADKDNEYFSDGVTEEILNALARTPGLRVAARTSAFFFKGKNESVHQMGEALKVGVLLEGSVRRAGSQLRITAELINVADGFHLWSDTFDGKAEDVFAIQSEVARRVQEVLKVKLLTGASPGETAIGTHNLEAYDLYLRARQFWNLRTGVDLQRALGLFQQALEKDPKFALAYAGLASTYSLLPDYAATPVHETNPKARAAARRALELDGRLAEAHAVLGACAQSEFDFATAEQEFQEALRLNPNYGTGHHWYSQLLVALGKRDEAIAESRKALASDPLSAVIRVSVGEHLSATGKYDEALIEFDEALKRSPEFVPAFSSRGRIFLAQKRIPEAIAEFERVRKQTGDTPYALGNLGYAYARKGRTNEAVQILKKLLSISASGSSASGEISFVSLGLGDLDQAFVWLERAVASRDLDPRGWKSDPLYDNLVKDPRYLALLKKFNLDK